jgi:putative DNA primase/helicase
MNAADIAAALGDPRREGRAWRCRCPLHGGHSLIVRDGDQGRVLATCWGGCDRLAVLTELRRCRLLGGDDHHRLDRHHRRLGDRRADNHDVGRAERQDDAPRIARARAIWDVGLPAPGTPVARYLAGRGIDLPPPPSLRYAPRCWHGAARRHLPAMVALVEHVERGIVGVHRTYLRADGADKAAVAPAKASLGPIGGGAVRLGMPRPSAWIAIGEGIETTLAVMMACAMPGWAALSVGGIRALILPLEATHIIICADHDASTVGQRAADDAAAQWLAEGRRVRIALPPEPDTDFADVLAASAAMGEVCDVA